MSSEDGLELGESTRNLLYVPDGPGDPNAFFTNPADETAFYEWASKKGLKGQPSGWPFFCLFREDLFSAQAHASFPPLRVRHRRQSYR